MEIPPQPTAPGESADPGETLIANLGSQAAARRAQAPHADFI
jgi:hypothetical protein